MNSKNTFIFFLLGIYSLFLVGCAGPNYRPIVDNKGVDLNRYEADLQECQVFATQTASAAQSAAVGAVAGAVLGSVVAAAAGSRYDRNASAKVGALTGAVGAGFDGEKNQKNIINRCLSGRGYRVLQ